MQLTIGRLSTKQLYFSALYWKFIVFFMIFLQEILKYGFHVGVIVLFKDRDRQVMVQGVPINLGIQ